MKAIVLALALLLFTSPVHADSIDGKAIFCSPTPSPSYLTALKNRTRDKETLANELYSLFYNRHFIFEAGKANTYRLDEKNPDKIILATSSKYSVFPFVIKWTETVDAIEWFHTLRRETLVKEHYFDWMTGDNHNLFMNCWLTTKGAIFEYFRLKGEEIKKLMKKNKL
jgi:hypothetical protein